MPLPPWYTKEKEKEKIEPEEFPGKTLGGKIGNTLIRFVKKIINSTTDWFEERLINFAVGVLVKVEQSGKTVLGSLVKELKKHKAIPDFLKPIFDEIEDPKHEIGAMLSSMAGSSAIGGLFGAIFDPLMAPVKYLLMEAIHPMYPPYAEGLAGFRRGVISKEMAIEFLDAHGIQHKFRDLLIEISRSLMGFADIRDSFLRGDTTEAVAREYIQKQGYDKVDVEKIFKLFIKIPTIAESIVANFRGEITDSELTEIAEKNGIKEEFLNILKSANRRLLGLGEIRSAYYREAKSDEWLTTQLKGFGYSVDDVEDIKKILPYYPAVPDLVRFAVREVYYPEYVEKYGLGDEITDEYLAAAKKAGLEKEQAENYWKSHWVLPSILQGYEMLHRGVIGSEELGDLFKAVDIMPYWRSRLEQISYRVLTRVDVRRMYNLGILDEAGVLDSYKKLGYNDKDAANMTDFTIAYYQQSEKNLTRSNVIDGYKRQYFSLEEAVTMLKELGYDDVEAEFYVAKADYDNEVTKKKEILKLTEESYKKAIIGDNEVISALSAEGFLASEVEYHLSRWTYTKKAKTTSPPKEDLKKWLKTKIITREDFITEMSGLGFSNKYINYYLKEMGQKGI
ncbi:hypothetical protein ES708_20879 [subsurface metagenome]